MSMCWSRRRDLEPSAQPPFQIAVEEDVDDALRLQYRYLDLRHERLQKNLTLRHRSIKFIRDYLDGAALSRSKRQSLSSLHRKGRDYVVPSRLRPGKFYALPQSPQQLKQLLMIAGFDRYYQIARCFRDEDLRADRQPEFTQLDLEMAFVEQNDILQLIEGCFTKLVENIFPNKRVLAPFPALTYADAQARFGSDKPDLRFGVELTDVSDLVARGKFQVFASAVQGGGQVKGICVPGCANYTRKQIDELAEVAQTKGAKGLAAIALTENEIKSPIAKFFSDEEIKTIINRLDGKQGDLLLFVADKPPVVAASLGSLRTELGNRLGLAAKDLLAFAWIVDFPLFEWNAETKRWDAMHHLFTSPKPEDIPLSTLTQDVSARTHATWSATGMN
jgi:aspartyl-tRNA synthetase